MSKETSEWLNRNVLVGMTDKRGHAWHYRADDQGDESNHYPGAIPVADVMRRLFDWEAIELPMFVAIPCDVSEATSVNDDGEFIKFVNLADRKAIATSDDFTILGTFKQSYGIHQGREWLLGNVANILGDAIAISSAGLLKERKVAWVECSVSDNVKTPEGIEFRPNLIACTSFDGSLATTYKRTVQLTVCDNTMAAALNESGQELKIRHSKYSGLKMDTARDALAIVTETADSFSAELAELCRTDVSDKQWDQVLEALVPIDADATNTRGATLAEAKRAELSSLYRHDNRVSPWSGTAFGVVQAFNTYAHHVQAVRGGTIRAERNMLSAINGATEQADKTVLETLGAVLAS